MKKPNPFAGKESKREEAAEKKMSPGAYARGEKKEAAKAPPFKKSKK